MKRMTCEMCGGTDLIKKDGMFVCQSCGCKYSPEEAKKIMIEGPVDISGSSIKIDNTDSIPIYLEIAENALESKNFFEAENYSSRIVEIDPKNSRAWFIKGKAVGWGNIRIEETVNCFGKAIDYATDDEIDELRKNCGIEIEELSKAFVRLMCERCEDCISQDSVSEIENCLKEIERITFLLLRKCDIKIEEFKKEIALIVEECANFCWDNIVWYEYQKNEYPTEHEFHKFTDRCMRLRNLLELSINEYEGDNDEDVRRYRSLISITEHMLSACAYKNGNVITCLTDNAKELNIDDIMMWHKKIKDKVYNYVIPERPKLGKYKKRDWAAIALNIMILGVCGYVSFWIFILFKFIFK